MLVSRERASGIILVLKVSEIFFPTKLLKRTRKKISKKNNNSELNIKNNVMKLALCIILCRSDLHTLSKEHISYKIYL